LCIRSWGYPHIVLNTGTRNWTHSVLCHELTHYLLSHWTVPRWLDEGIAMVMQHDIVQRPEMEIHLLACAPTFQFMGIQGFWSGAALESAEGEAGQVMYALAEELVRCMVDVYGERFDAFVRKAHWSDGGQAAAAEVLGAGLGECMSHVLGAGDWAPRPETWKKEEMDVAAG
jgi:hypothetical protein